MSRRRIEIVGSNLVSWGEQLASEGHPVCVWCDAVHLSLFEGNNQLGADISDTMVFYESRLPFLSMGRWYPVP